MKENNKYSKPQYIMYSFIVFFIACFWFRGCFIREIWHFDMKDTIECIFYPVFFISFLINIAVTEERQRNAGSLLNVMIPCEIMAVLCYFDDAKYVVLVSAILFLFSSIAFAVWVLSNKIKTKDEKRRRRIILNRLKYSLSMSKYSFIVSFFILLIIAFSYNYITPVTEAYKFEKYQSSEEVQLLTMEHQYKTLEPLQDEKIWSELDTEQRKEILEIVLKMEIDHLGLPHMVSLEVAENENKNRYGEYSDRDKKITLYNIDNMTGEKALQSLLHEVFHSAEHRFVDVYLQHIPEEYKDLYFFKDAWIYSEEFLDYKTTSDDIQSYILYATQYCERHADDYAEERSSFIITEIYRWVNGYETGED